MVIWIVNVLLIALGVVFLWKFSLQMPLKKIFFPALFVKVFAGVGVGLVYRFYYHEEGDTFFLFNLAAWLADLAKSDFSTYADILFFNKFNTETKTFFFVWNQPRALFFVKILSFINILTSNNYWISSAYLSLFSFTGFWLLANFLVSDFQVKPAVSAFAFLFFPSVVFWTSGVLKESLMSGCLGVLVYLFLKRIHFKTLIPIVFCCMILWTLKYYIAVILFSVLSAYKVSVLIFPSRRVGQIFSFIAILCTGSFILSFLHPNLMLDYFPQALYLNYNEIQKSGANFMIEGFNPTWISILQNAPQMLIAGLFRPFLWECNYDFQLFAGLENLLLLILAITTFLFILIVKTKIPFTAVSMIVFVGTLAVLIAFAAPNFGSMERYRTAYMPFFILLIAQINPVFLYFFRSGNNREVLQQAFRTRTS